MLFSEKLGALLRLLNVTRAELAREAGLDASLISRFLAGERVPSRFSPQLEKLAAGTASLAAHLGCTREICALCNVSYTEDTGVLFDALYAWIHLEESNLRPQRAQNAKQTHPASRSPMRGPFAELLEELMRAAGVSNAQLARYLKADPALVSRFRSGVRTPSGRALSEICMFFSTLKCGLEQRCALCAALAIPFTDNPETYFEAATARFGRLEPRAEQAMANNLLELLDGAEPGGDERAGSNAMASPEPPVDLQTTQYYAGNSGLRAAMLRLLREARDAACPVLYLYTDLTLFWMKEDDTFMEQWPGLLAELLTAGTAVKVVLNFDRDVEESLRSIERWLPLLNLGNVGVYLCIRRRDRRFCFTLMVAEGLACVSSFSVAGTEADAKYFYTRDQDVLQSAGAQFLAMLRNNCSRLSLFVQGQERAYLSRLSEYERAPGDADALLYSLPHYTMPYELMEAMLRRAGVDPDAAQEALQYHEVSSKRALINLEQYSVTDFISLPSAGALKCGEVAAAFPGMRIRGVAYTPAEYAAHMKATLRLLKEFPLYSLFLLPQTPYQHINLIARQEEGVLIYKTGGPPLALLFDHPELCAAVTAYLNTLKLRGMRVYPGRGQGFNEIWRFLQEGAAHRT